MKSKGARNMSSKNIRQAVKMKQNKKKGGETSLSGSKDKDKLNGLL